jgi:hypothetical protein
VKFVGIDFSGAKDAGKKIWIAEGVLDGEQVDVHRLRPARDLTDGARDLTSALAALRNYIRTLGPATIGIDAPNSLPSKFEPGDWSAWLVNFSKAHLTPQTFKSSCTERWLQLSEGNAKEGRRECDKEAGTPWSAWNERLYRQTWHVLTGVYAPLVAEGIVTVAPFHAPNPGKVRLAEICPASTLKSLGLYNATYKDTRADERERRSFVLDALRDRANVRMREDLQQLAIANRGGDALDAVIALAATVRCRHRIEGHVATSEGMVFDWA